MEPISAVDFPIDDPNISDHPFVGVVVRVKNKRTERGIRLTFWGRNPLSNCFEDLLDIGTHFCANGNDIFGRDAD